jgi:hypothetical protein
MNFVELHGFIPPGFVNFVKQLTSELISVMIKKKS